MPLQPETTEQLEDRADSIARVSPAPRNLTYRRCVACCPRAVYEFCATCLASDATTPVCVDCAAVNVYRGLAEHPQRHSDLLGFCLDDEILDLVEALNTAGFVTTTSCEGTHRICLWQPYVGLASLEMALALVALAYDYETKDSGRAGILGIHYDPLDNWRIEVRLQEGQPFTSSVLVALPRWGIELLVAALHQSTFAEARQLFAPFSGPASA